MKTQRPIRVIKRGSLPTVEVRAESKPAKPELTLKQSVERFLFAGQSIQQHRARRESLGLDQLAVFMGGKNV